MANTGGYGRALGGALGCIRACMIHLEDRKKLKNTFKSPFRDRPPWPDLDHTRRPPLAPDVEERYARTGKIEDARDYITYGKRENYGTDSKDDAGEAKRHRLVD